jgi:hypothetical protein
VAESVNFASSYLENLGGGRFSIEPLPPRAQFAPVFGMLAGDRNGDGNLDVLLVGNSYATEVQSGWFDASVGTVLLGSGDGRFEARSGNETGFFVDGDAKAIAELWLGGERTAVLVTQNADSLRIFAGAEAAKRHIVALRPGDVWASLTFADGRKRREELYHGSTYLSQSSRVLTVPEGVVEVVVHDRSGGARTEVPSPPGGVS